MAEPAVILNDDGKPPRTPPRRKDNAEFDAMVRRCIRAYARRAAAGDTTILPLMLTLRDEVEDAIETAVQGLNDRGFSWTEIGRDLGMYRQNAHRRWARKEVS